MEDPVLTGTGRLPPYVIVVGNEKGGTGKSTTALHLAVGLLKAGYSVGSIDLDARQGTLSRYLENRADFAAATGRALDMPEHRRVERSAAATRAAAEAEEAARLRAALDGLSGRQFVVIDTPASDSHLSRLGHAAADTLITPLNDSFLDIDLLAVVDRARREVLAPSVYSRLVWEQNNRRVAANRAPIDWIVMRNRLTHIEARNKREIADVLERLAKRIGFRLAPGFGERVVFRELFPRGLTVLDPPDAAAGASLSNLSHFAARREVEALLHAIGVVSAPVSSAGATPEAVAT